VTYEGRCWRGQHGRNDARTRRRGVLTDASDGVDGGVGEDGGMASQAREAWRAFYNPQENLAVGVSEIRTCPGQRPDMPATRLWNPA
jgi:hypothetical protein